METAEFDYAKAKQELDDVLAWFDSADADVSQSIAKFEEAKKLIEQLEAFLNDAERALQIKVASLDDDD